MKDKSCLDDQFDISSDTGEDRGLSRIYIDDLVLNYNT